MMTYTTSISGEIDPRTRRLLLPTRIIWGTEGDKVKNGTTTHRCCFQIDTRLFRSYNMPEELGHRSYNWDFFVFHSKSSFIKQDSHAMFTISYGLYKEYYDDIRFVRNKVFILEQLIPIEIEIDGKDNSCIHFVAYKSGSPVGTARMGKDGKIGRVAVIKEFRKFGIGKLLMQEIENVAVAIGINKIFFNAQLSAKPFYDKIGYKSIGEIFIEANIDHIYMEKKLTAQQYDAPEPATMVSPA